MAEVVTCPSCNREYAARPELAGKRAKCKCGGRVEFPAASTEVDLLDDAPAAAVATAAPSDPYALRDTAPAVPPVRAAVAPVLSAAICRGCRNPLAAGSVICTRCGVNQQTGAAIKTTVMAAARPMAAPPSSTLAPRRSFFGGGRSGGVNILIGIVLIIIGGAITLGTYSAAEQGGGSYTVMYGMIGVGIWRLIRGCIQMASGD